MFRKMLVCSASVYMLNMNMNIIFSLSLTFRSVDTLLLSDRSVVLCKQTNNHPSHKTNKQTKNRKQNKTKSTKKPFFPKTFQKIQSTYSVRHLSYFFYLWPQANANKKPYILSVIYLYPLSLAQFQVHHFAEICRLTFLCVGCCIHF